MECTSPCSDQISTDYELYHKLQEEFFSCELDKLDEFITEKKIQLMNQTDFDNRCVVHWCVSNNDKIRLLALLMHGFSVDPRDELSWTPLHIATASCYIDLVHVLLSYNADPTLRTDCSLNTALHIAINKSNAKIVDMIIKIADKKILNIKNATGLDPLVLSVHVGVPCITQLLLPHYSQKKINIYKLIDVAIENVNYDMLNLLLNLNIATVDRIETSNISDRTILELIKNHA